MAESSQVQLLTSQTELNKWLERVQFLCVNVVVFQKPPQQRGGEDNVQDSIIVQTSQAEGFIS